MNILKSVWDWILKNLGNVFSFLGLIFTIYFGITVPKWINAYKVEKIQNAQTEIVQSAKEFIYSDSLLTIQVLNSMVHGKELAINQKIPLTLMEFLTLTEDSFMEDKFLPLNERQALIREIETLKKSFPIDTSTQKIDQQSKHKFGILEWISVIVSIFATLLGLVSFYVKQQIDKDKEEEIKNEEISIFKDHGQLAYRFERQIGQIIGNYVEMVRKNMGDSGIDFQFKHKEKMYYIEVKYLTRSKVGLNSFSQLRNYVRDKIGEAWLIYNTELTPLVIKEIDKFNQNNKDIKIKAINVSDIEEFKDKIGKLLNE